MEPEERVAAACRKGPCRFFPGFGYLAVAVEVPGEDVVSENARAALQRFPGAADRICTGMVIGVEQRELQIDVDTVGPVEPGDDGHEVVGVGRSLLLAGRREGITFRDRVLRKRLDFDDPIKQLGRLGVAACADEDTRPARLSCGESGE